MCFNNNDNDINVALLQMRSTAVGAGLPSPATFLSNRPVRAQLPQINRKPITFNADDECCEALETHQGKYTKDNDTHKDSFSFPVGSTEALQY